MELSPIIPLKKKSEAAKKEVKPTPSKPEVVHKECRKVHIVPSVPLKDLPPQLQKNSEFMSEYKKLIKDTKNHIKFTQKGSSKRSSSSESQLHYLHDEKQMKALFAKLAPGSELVIHVESVPFIIGFNISSIYDLTAAKCARILISYDIPEDITITLQGCNTATKYKAKNTNGNIFNFAKDLSTDLFEFGKKKIQVKGYTGALEVKENGKMSTCYGGSGLSEGKSEKVKNCSAAEATSIYTDKKEIQTGKTLTTGIVYQFFKNYIRPISNNLVVNNDVQKILKKPANLIYKVSSGEIPNLTGSIDNTGEKKPKKKSKKPVILRSAFAPQKKEEENFLKPRPTKSADDVHNGNIKVDHDALQKEAKILKTSKENPISPIEEEEAKFLSQTSPIGITPGNSRSQELSHSSNSLRITKSYSSDFVGEKEKKPRTPKALQVCRTQSLEFPSSSWGASIEREETNLSAILVK